MYLWSVYGVFNQYKSQILHTGPLKKGFVFRASLKSHSVLGHYYFSYFSVLNALSLYFFPHNTSEIICEGGRAYKCVTVSFKDQSSKIA